MGKNTAFQPLCDEFGLQQKLLMASECNVDKVH